MEHEVFVPVPVQSLRAVLTDPVRVARCVPGLQQDADASADPLAGRLKVRAGGQTVTYRGALHLAVRDDGGCGLEGEGVEARGSGGVKVTLTTRLVPAEGGTVLAFTGTARAEGRLAELPGDTLATTARRLLDRFGEALAQEADRTPGGGADLGGPDLDGVDLGGPDLGGRDPGGIDGPDLGGADLDGVDPDGPDLDGVGDGGSGDASEGPPGVFGASVPPSSLDPFDADDFPVDDTEPPAEAAHARRTMIGRSAEEVDHAPPRGRYAPVPGPDTTAGTGVLRWLAPAAALVLASVVVLGRALRRRRRSRRT
ncbi:MULTISPECIES: SRPBCC domain-containing protein [Streptomyces]|uniref:Carbon monoxide dehydrogenase n=1 Tax=Streptomyces sudanensis TaxID=436397 RepID=A0ABY4TFH0_9ACTN|nr:MULTISPECIES: SRPBCC domain-containing protein [Streptomyces]URN17023.1 carbon monoxide dehydrogenase [Streptomyces sudanensis]